MTANTEDLIELTGRCGPFQILHTIFLYTSRILGTWGLNLMVFGNFNPGWTCENPATHSVSFNNSWVDYSITQFNASMTCSNISQCSAVYFNPNGNTPVSEWMLICDRTWIMSLISTMQIIGQLIGVVITGYISENMGRKAGVYGNLLMFLLANIITVFSNSWQMFAVMRFFIGIFAGGINPTSLVYAMEFLTPKWRGIVGGLPIINTGLLVYSVMIYFERDWRLVHISTAVIAFVMMFTGLWASESMRWLAVHGKTDDAKRVVRRMAIYNRTSVPEMNAIDHTAEEEKRRNQSKIYTYRDLFRSRKICIITLKLMVLWSFESIAFISLGLSVGELPGDFYMNFIFMSIFEVLTVSVNGLVVNRIGRVKAGASYFGIGFLALLTALALSLSGQLSKEHVIFAILPMTTRVMIAGGRAIVHLCNTELLPTNVRAIGFSFCVTISRIGAVIAPFLIPGENFSFDSLMIILSVFMLSSTLIFLSLPESKDKAMDDIDSYECIVSNDSNLNGKDTTMRSAVENTDVNSFETIIDNNCNSACRNEHKSILPSQNKMYMDG